MANKEAKARIKINKLLEAAGWRFFPEGNAPANICLELSVTIKSSDLDDLGDNFEKTSKYTIGYHQGHSGSVFQRAQSQRMKNCLP